MAKRLTGKTEEHKPRLNAAPPTIDEVTDFSTLRRYFRVKADEWDAFLIGDGSGTKMSLPCGWGSVLITADSVSPELFCGGTSHGSNSFSEIMAVLHPLMVLVDRKAGVKQGGFHTHIISDSEYVVNGLQVDDPIWASNVKAHRSLWMAVCMCRRQGLVLHGHHVPRDTVNFQKVCHTLANTARRSQIGLTGQFNEQANSYM